MKASKQNIGESNNEFAWRFAFVILAIIAGTESLPFIFGTGYEAKWDWSFIYTTMRFGLLPAACLVHAGLIVFRTIKPKHTPMKGIQISSLVVSLGYLIVLFLHPLPLTVWK